MQRRHEAPVRGIGRMRGSCSVPCARDAPPEHVGSRSAPLARSGRNIGSARDRVREAGHGTRRFCEARFRSLRNWRTSSTCDPGHVYGDVVERSRFNSRWSESVSVFEGRSRKRKRGQRCNRQPRLNFGGAEGDRVLIISLPERSGLKKGHKKQ